jgi:DNA ligase-1
MGTDDVEVKLWSRTRKQYETMQHIEQALKRHFRGLRKRIMLDGELYRVGFTFEELSSFIKRVQPGTELIEYHVYDVVVDDMKWRDRWTYLSGEFGHCQWPLVLVETMLANNEAELAAHEEDYVNAGYEGLMARNIDGLYEQGKRSDGLLKVKRFQDAEFQCINVEAEMRTISDSQGTREVPYPKFVCLTAEGKQFKTSMIGKMADVVKYLSQPELVIGKLLTVKFQGLTDEGKPRFPKARFYHSF